MEVIIVDQLENVDSGCNYAINRNGDVFDSSSIPTRSETDLNGDSGFLISVIFYRVPIGMRVVYRGSEYIKVSEREITNVPIISRDTATRAGRGEYFSNPEITEVYVSADLANFLRLG